MCEQENVGEQLAVDLFQVGSFEENDDVGILFRFTIKSDSKPYVILHTKERALEIAETIMNLLGEHYEIDFDA